MTDLAESHPLPLSRSRELVPVLRDGCLTAFFIVMAFSISATQILLASLVVLAFPWSRPFRDVGALAWFRDGVARLWAETEPLRRNPLTRPFVLFVALTFLSALLSGDVLWSLWIARDTLRILIFYLVLNYTRDSIHALRMWQGFLVALTLMACYGLAQAYVCGGRPSPLPEAWLGEICLHTQRVRGPFSIYMTFGGVLLLGVLFFLAYLANMSWAGVFWRRAWWMVPGSAATLTALALTYSRNAWLGLGAGALGLVLTARRMWQTVAVLAAIAAVVLVVSPHAVFDRARSTADLQDRTIRDRLAMWRSGVAMIADHPLLGVGPGEVRAWYAQYRRPDAVRPSTGHLHNSAVQVAAERGLPALAIWLWLWVLFFREGFRILGRVGPEPSRQRALVSASLAAVAGFLVAGLFEHNFGDGEVVMLVYALMALPFIVERERNRTRTGRETAP